MFGVNGIPPADALSTQRSRECLKCCWSICLNSVIEVLWNTVCVLRLTCQRQWRGKYVCSYSQVDFRCRKDNKKPIRTRKKLTLMPIVDEEPEPQNGEKFYNMKKEELCCSCDQKRRHDLSVRLMESLSQPNTRESGVANSMLSPWSTDMISLTFMRARKQPLQNNGHCKAKGDTKISKSKQTKTRRQPGSFKHLDNMADYIAQYRQPKLSLVSRKAKPSFARVLDLNSMCKSMNSR